MALRLKLKPHSHHHCTIPSLRHLSSSSSSSPPPPSPSDQSPPESEHQHEPHSQPHPSVSSYFSDIKQRLGTPPSPPRRIPLNPSPPPPFLSSPQTQKPPASLEEIRKHLAAFRAGGSGSNAYVPSSAPSFQNLLKNNAQNNPTGSGQAPSFDAIRQSLRQSRSSESLFSLKTLQEKLRSQEPQQGASPIIGSDGKQLPEAIFGREAKERRMAQEGGKESKRVTSQFIKAYTHQELGEKLVRLRPEEGEKKKKGGFSLSELNQRLIKLREMEEKEKDTASADNPFKTLRESLHNIQNAEERKTVQPRMSIFPNLGGLVTPTYMLKPPQEQLLEKYFHPDHMSSAEKMKLELKKVRDEFKMSESDCGSTRVQVAQLTTKIKFLSTVLHKKDKHSIKGLQEMVQRRKKLLKYLRRTDWDSYCLVLSKLGLRDVPEYKAPDYKTKPQTTTKSKSKSKKSKSRMRA